MGLNAKKDHRFLGGRGQNRHNSTFILKQRSRMASRAFIYGGDRKFVELCGANFHQEGPPVRGMSRSDKGCAACGEQIIPL